MSFAKAEQLLQLATMVAARHLGITLDSVIEEFRVSKRTAQRMLHALEVQFPDTETHMDEEGRKRWRLPSSALRDLLTLLPEELAAFDLAIEQMKRAGLAGEATDLKRMREKILALVPRAKATRLEADHESLLIAQGLAARPGPKPRLNPEVGAAITEAIKACRILRITYTARGRTTAESRRVEPYGLLSGFRRYLVARVARGVPEPMRLFRIDSIRSAAIEDTFFERDAEFDLAAFANRSFGTFQNDAEFGDVIWRFKPEAADHARGFEFHPEQETEDLADGSLIIRFKAAGLLEMCWHLYAWGDKVEVLAPVALKKMVDGYQRSDFPVLP